jgi:hypothetical protein
MAVLHLMFGARSLDPVEIIIGDSHLLCYQLGKAHYRIWVDKDCYISFGEQTQRRRSNSPSFLF